MVRILASVSLAAMIVAAAACGGVGTNINNLDNPDAGTTDSATSAGNPPPTAFPDPFQGAPPYSRGQSGGDNSHNAGQSCMQSGCHGTLTQGGGEAPAFLIGGTVYQDYFGNVPATGVEIRILDTAGNAASAYSDSGGNFYISAGQSSVGFPAIIGARDGTSTRPMIKQLATASMGSCGQSPCHVPGGSPKTGKYYPIHVP